MGFDLSVNLVVCWVELFVYLLGYVSLVVVVFLIGIVISILIGIVLVCYFWLKGLLLFFISVI